MRLARRSNSIGRGPQAWPYLLIAALVTLLLFGIVLVQRDRLVRAERVRVAAERVSARHEEQALLLFRLRDADAAQRGYLLTGGAEFLAAYRKARQEIARDLAAPTSPFAAAPVATRLIFERLELLDRTIRIGAAGRTDGAAALVAQDQSRPLVARLAAMIETSRRREAAETVDRRRETSETRSTWNRLVLGAAVGMTTLLSALYVGWQRRRFGHERAVAGAAAAARNRTILDSTIDAILIVNPEGRIERMNTAACKLLGYDRKSDRSLTLDAVIDLALPGPDFAAHVGLKDGTLQRGLIADRVARSREGARIPVDVALGVLRVGSGDHLLVSLRDITERKRMEDAKDELVSTVSHELRTPLTSVVGSLGLLRAGAAGELPASAARLVNIAENNSKRLIRLINDMLDIDGFTSGKLNIDRQPIDLGDVLRQGLDAGEGLARDRGVAVEVEATGRIGEALVNGDTDRIVQVVGNLLSNAIRVSPPGSPVEVGLFVEGEQATVFVDDRGPGVPIAFRDRIFGRFERATPHDGASGTGLGLAISREIVQRHDGRIWFEDRPGGGTRFAFAIPLLARSTVRSGGAARLLLCMPPGAPATDIGALAHSKGWDADVAADAESAWTLLQRGRYAALLIDTLLPPDGGVTLADKVRRAGRRDAKSIMLLRTGEDATREAPARYATIEWRGEVGDTERIADAIRGALGCGTTSQSVILHLDDDRDLLDVVAASLAPEARVVSASDLASARALLRQVRPDAAILDPGLPDGSGLDLLPLLTDAAGRRIPTIVYSAQDLPPEVGEQVDAVLVKSRGSLPDLQHLVHQVLRSSAMCCEGMN